MTLLQLEYFTETANNGSTLKTARLLNVSQSTISSSIKALETELGTELFVRTSKGVVLNRAGQCLYDHAVRILQMTETAVMDMKKFTGEGTIFRLGIPVLLCQNYWPDLYMRLKEKFPLTEFQLTNDGTSTLLKMLENDRLDAVIALTKIPVSEKLKRLQLAERPGQVVSMSVKNPLAKEKSVSYSQLLPYPVLGYQGDEVKTVYLKSAYEALGAKFQYIQHCSQISTLIQLLKRNVGIAYLNANITDQYPELVSIPIREEKETIPLCLIWKDDKAANGKMKKAAKEIGQYFASLQENFLGGLPQ